MKRNHVIALARGTFLETVRDRVFYLVAVFGFVMMASTTILSPLTIGAQGKIVSDVGLAAMTLLGLLVVVFVGSGMVRKELDKGTITTILSKPVGRREYLLGKFLGLNLTMAAMLAVMSVMFLLMLLLSPGAFSLRFGVAFYMAFMELSLITAIVVFFSTCVSPVLAAVFTLGALARHAGARHFETIEALVAAVLEQLALTQSVLVKGSRFMKMERVVAAIQASQHIHQEAFHAA